MNKFFVILSLNLVLALFGNDVFSRGRIRGEINNIPIIGPNNDGLQAVPAPQGTTEFSGNNMPGGVPGRVSHAPPSGGSQGHLSPPSVPNAPGSLMTSGSYYQPPPTFSPPNFANFGNHFQPPPFVPLPAQNWATSPLPGPMMIDPLSAWGINLMFTHLGGVKSKIERLYQISGKLTQLSNDLSRDLSEVAQKQFKSKFLANCAKNQVLQHYKTEMKHHIGWTKDFINSAQDDLAKKKQDWSFKPEVVKEFEKFDGPLAEFEKKYTENAQLATDWVENQIQATSASSDEIFQQSVVKPYNDRLHRADLMDQVYANRNQILKNVDSARQDLSNPKVTAQLEIEAAQMLRDNLTYAENLANESLKDAYSLDTPENVVRLMINMANLTVSSIHHFTAGLSSGYYQGFYDVSKVIEIVFKNPELVQGISTAIMNTITDPSVFVRHVSQAVMDFHITMARGNTYEKGHAFGKIAADIVISMAAANITVGGKATLEAATTSLSEAGTMENVGKTLVATVSQEPTISAEVKGIQDAAKATVQATSKHNKIHKPRGPPRQNKARVEPKPQPVTEVSAPAQQPGYLARLWNYVSSYWSGGSAESATQIGETSSTKAVTEYERVNAIRAARAAGAADSARRLGVAVADIKRITNSASHIFGPKKIVEHKLEGFLGKFSGDQIHALKSLEDAAQALANQGKINDIFETTVLVKDAVVTVKGRVIDGVVKIGTAYIP